MSDLVRNLPKDLVMPPMRTEVPYVKPSIHTHHGHYYCGVCWYPEGFMYAHLKIDLVWFNHLGWYHRVELETQRPGTYTPPYEFKHDFGNRDKIWTEGRMLPLCAEAADLEARRLIEARGLTMPKLPLYVLHGPILGEDAPDGAYAAYLDAGIILNGHVPPSQRNRR